MVSGSLVLAYHGCDKSLAEKIITGQEQLWHSERPWDWLGHGIYFWEDSPTRALHWAQEESRKTNGKVTTPAVIGAAIDLGNCLNLTEAEALALVRAAYEVYKTICAVSDTPEARNRGTDLRARYLDCAVMETLHQIQEQRQLQPFDTVRGFFVEGRPLYPRAGFRELDHIQICVRSPKQILGYFWPRGR